MWYCRKLRNAATIYDVLSLRRALLGGSVFLIALIAIHVTSPTNARTASARANLPIVLVGVRNDANVTTFGSSLTEALRIELEQSPILQFVNSSGVDNVRHTQCGKRHKVTLVAAMISKANAGYQLTLIATTCGRRQGVTVVRRRTSSVADIDVLDALSRAAVALRIQLGESPISVRDSEVPIRNTTHSLRALALYNAALDLKRDKGDTASLVPLQTAIRLDPTFPLPYASLSAIYHNLRQPVLALKNARRAYDLRKRVGRLEQMRILANYFLTTGDMSREILLYQRWQTLYPHDFTPYNNLGNDYAEIGRLRESLAEYQRALQLAPSVITYTNVAGMYLALNRSEDAQAAVKRAFRSGLDGTYLHQTLYLVAFVRGDDAEMRHEISWALQHPSDQDALLSMQSDTEAYHGRLEAARASTERAVVSAIRADSRETAALWLINDALRQAELGNTGLASHGITRALALSSGRDVLVTAALTWARLGNAANARAVLERLTKAYPTDAPLSFYWLPTIRAAIALDESRYSDAINLLKPAERYERGAAGTFISYLYPAYVRGEVYLREGEAQRAIGEFKRLDDNPGIVLNFVTGCLAKLELARAYSMLGERGAASRQYDRFLSLWSGADANGRVFQAAKRESASLHSPPAS